jgi:hypothetical protein
MSIWNQDRVPGAENRFALGCWLPRRKMASAAWVPGLRARRKFVGGRPVFMVFDFSLAASQTLESKVPVSSDFICYELMISVSNGGTQTNPGARVQVLDSKGRKRFSIVGVNDTNFAGAAKSPFILRHPYRFHANGTILMRCQNLQTSSNVVQVVLHGVQDL